MQNPPVSHAVHVPGPPGPTQKQSQDNIPKHTPITHRTGVGWGGMGGPKPSGSPHTPVTNGWGGVVGWGSWPTCLLLNCYVGGALGQQKIRGRPRHASTVPGNLSPSSHD